MLSTHRITNDAVYQTSTFLILRNSSDIILVRLAKKSEVLELDVKQTLDQSLEIVLIRHGWPTKDKNVHPDHWVLDFTAYLDLARYLDVPEIQRIEQIYTSPQVKAKQTASFYFGQVAACTQVAKVDDLAEARRSGVYYDDYRAVVAAYLTGAKTEEGWESFADLRQRAKTVFEQIAHEGRRAERRRIAVVGHGLFFTALQTEIRGLASDERLSQWEAMPFGPFARIQINAASEMEWLGQILLPESEEL